MEVHGTSTPGWGHSPIVGQPGYDTTMTWTPSPMDNTSDSASNVTTMTALVRNKGLAKAEIAVQCVILFLALAGNSIVLIVLLRIRKKRKLSRMNLMIVHLSFADLFVAFFNTLPQLIWDITHRFQGGDFLCRFVKLFQLVAMFASSYVLVTTAIDRFLAICYPLTTHYWTKTKMLFLVGVAWGLSLVFALPQIFIFSYIEIQPGAYDCWANFDPAWTMQWYITYITVAIYIIPFFCLVVAYGCICYVVWNSMRFKEKAASVMQKDKRSCSKGMENGSLLKAEALDPASSGGQGRNGLSRNPRAHVRGGMSQAKVKTVKLTLTVIICYLLCWGPFFVSQMWAAWDPKAPYEGTAMVIIMLLPSLNSCTNPWIYLGFSDNLHRQVLRCLRTRGRPQLRASTTFDYETRGMRSTTVSHTDFTRMESTSFR